MVRKTHHYYLLPLSPWPLIRRLCAFNLAFSLLSYLKFKEVNFLYLNLLFISVCSFCWWLFYGTEINKSGSNSFTLENGLKTSMIMFIRSEVLFFFSFFWSYRHFFLSPSMESGLFWPPKGVEIFDFINVPLINTTVLLSSGICTTIRHHYLNESNKKIFIKFLLITITLGSIFTLLQAAEYQSSFFSIRDSTFGRSFFMLTGFHGLHVIIGTLFLGVSLSRSVKLGTSKESSLNFEIAAWYWHFVDVVWIFLYFLIYYLNN